MISTAVKPESLASSEAPVPKDRWAQRFMRRIFLGKDGKPGSGQQEQTYPWYVVLWLTGVDYFSTLGYQPGLALIAAGVLSLPATAVLAAVTLFGAVPTYAAVARRSYAGQGSIALLEHLLSGWKSKIFVLVLIGFAATDFVITMTLSAADAAVHAIANPYLHPLVGNAQISVTLGLLLLLAFIFWLGFKEAIGFARYIAIPFLLLNLVVLARGLWEIVRHPDLLHHWTFRLHQRGDWTGILFFSALIFPRLALGLSGFETGVAVMPLVSGEGDTPNGVPRGRIQNTHKLLVTAALIMTGILLLSSFVTTLLISESEYRIGGPAAGRAISYLAHRLLGNLFGAAFDLSTIVILWFAGASAMAGLVNLIPRYLPRFGMAPDWVAYRRPLVLVLLAINVIITLAFRANVEAQSGAYATGVLVLMLSSAVAVTLSSFKEGGLRHPLKWLAGCYFFVISLVFLYTLGANIVERTDGILIGSCFILILLMASGISRYFRAREMRISDFSFADQESEDIWKTITGGKVNLIPGSEATPEDRKALGRKVLAYVKLDGPLAFLHVNLLDNRSDFMARIRIRVRKEEDHFVIEVSGAVAIANTIAFVSELLEPVNIVVGLTNRNLMKQSFSYMFWGEGETGLMLYSILLRHWEAAGEQATHPHILMISE
jgi:hypothetical protein